MSKISRILMVLLIFLFGHGSFANGVKILHTEKNEIGSLWVFEHQKVEGLRCFSFSPPPSKVIQSCVKVADPELLFLDYQKMMLGALFLENSPKKILIIGLGGGSMANALLKLVPQSQIDIVEINPAMPSVAEKYFFFDRKNPNITLFIEDGFKFMESVKAETYDIIFVDAFTEEYVPESFLTSKFVDNLKHSLVENGIVVFNTFANNKSAKLEKKLYKNAFGKMYKLSYKNSLVLVGSKGNLPSISSIEQTSLEWRFKFAAIGISQEKLTTFFQSY